MYPDTPTPEHLAGEVIHHLASEWIGPIRDLVVLHYKEMAQTGMDDAAACRLAIQAQSFLLDYVHHLLVDTADEDTEDADDTEVGDVEVDTSGVPTVTVDPETAAALKAVLAERGIDLGDVL